jgi:hypothetical protein
METVTIKSAHDGITLEFSGYSGGYYNVSVNGTNCHGAGKVYAYEPASKISAFFHDMAANSRGWNGKKNWGSLEGELSLSATCDSTGHITLSVELHSGPYPFDWRLSAVLLIEAGQLERIASQVEKFIGRNSAD